MAIALPVFLVQSITELLSGELTSRKPFKTVTERHTKKPCLKHSFSRLITIAYMNRTNRREQRGCAGGAPRFPRTPQGYGPSRKFRRAVASGWKKGLPANRQPLHKGASGMSEQLSPEKAGFPPPPGSLLTGFVGHKSRHLPVRVPVPNFAKRFPCQVSEYQQCETHYQHTPEQGTSWQFHSLLLLSTQSRSVTIGAKQRCHALVQRMRLTASLYTSERSLFPTEITKTTTFSSITWYTRR